MTNAPTGKSPWAISEEAAAARDAKILNDFKDVVRGTDHLSGAALAMKLARLGYAGREVRRLYVAMTRSEENNGHATKKGTA